MGMDAENDTETATGTAEGEELKNSEDYNDSKISGEEESGSD